jgi:hypothetical protein
MVSRLVTGGIVAALAAVLLVPALSGAQTPLPLPGSSTQVPDATAPPVRASEPIVMTGQQFPAFSAPANQTAKLPLTDFGDCLTTNTDTCSHNHYATPEADTGDKLGHGTPVDRLLGYRWDAQVHAWRQIPFQVDEVFTRYLQNSASAFSFYSGDDKHTTYAYDREGWRYTDNAPGDVCKAIPFSVGKDKQGHDIRPKTTPDPVPGLDDNDELSFMASDAGPQAPSGTPAPSGIEGVQEVAIRDPSNPQAAPTYVYVMKAAAGGPKPAYDASSGYVSYKRDPLADTFEKSQSGYRNYGNAARGPVCDANGNVITKDPDITDPKDPDYGKPPRRRPRDYATVQTGRYRFRYDGRWLLTALSISPDGGQTYGPDLVDRWKARAFAQDRESKTPCCGYEEEDTHWGGSSTLLGERWGPVRAIRETWGADSGTNVIRRETFYRDEMRMKSWLRVHPIPPLDGIYAQWDFNAGRMTRYFNRDNPNGVPVDGKNDEAFGNLDDPCNPHYSAGDPFAQQYRSFYGEAMLCDVTKPYHQSVDFVDPSFSQANAALEWNEITGPWGTIVDRYTADARDLTPGGAVQSLLAVPYYRDDSCFDDGTGTDPGPRVNLHDSGKVNEEPRTASDGSPRKCWAPSDGVPDASDHYFQGSIGTHGVHILMVLESDNARQTVPLDEIVSEQRMVMLAPKTGGTAGGGAGGQPGSDGQPGGADGGLAGPAYGVAFDHPLDAQAGPATTVRDASAPVVRLTLRVSHRHQRFSLRWRGSDTGGSGLRSYALQVRAPGDRWRTLKAHTLQRSYALHARRAGSYAFRVRAVDGAGNTGRWSLRRAVLRR